MAKAKQLSPKTAKSPWTNPLEYAMDCKRDRITKTIGAGRTPRQYDPIPGYTAWCPDCFSTHGEGETPQEAWEDVHHDLGCRRAPRKVGDKAVFAVPPMEGIYIVPTTKLVGEGNDGRRVYHESPLQKYTLRVGESWSPYGVPAKKADSVTTPLYECRPALMSPEQVEAYRATRQNGYLKLSRQRADTPKEEEKGSESPNVVYMRSLPGLVKGVLDPTTAGIVAGYDNREEEITPTPVGEDHYNSNLEGLVTRLQYVTCLPKQVADAELTPIMREESKTGRCHYCGVSARQFKGKNGRGPDAPHKAGCPCLTPYWMEFEPEEIPSKRRVKPAPKPVAPAAPKQGEANPLARFRKS